MKIVRDIIKSPLFRVTSINSISVLLKIGIGLITSKIIAVFVGPSGMALVGNFRNFISSLETISTFGVQNGVVKYVAENDKDQNGLKQILSTLFFCLVIMAVVLSTVLFMFANYWNDVVFGQNFQYQTVIKALAIALPWYACSLILISVINGLNRFKEVVYITIAGNILGLVMSVILILKLHTFGALLAIVISPSLLFFVALYFINKQIKLIAYISKAHFSWSFLKNLSEFSLMALVSSVILPIVYLVIRKDIILKVGIIEAGYWEGITRISLHYLMFISTILVVYFLPKLVHANTNAQTKTVFLSYFKAIMPVFILGLILVFLLRDFVVQLLFTDDFTAVKDLFFWQLAGDVLKGFSLILGYNLIAKKQTLVFIFTEILSVLSMFIFSKILIPIYGIQGVVIAHFATYFIYLSVLVVCSREIIFNNSRSNAV